MWNTPTQEELNKLPPTGHYSNNPLKEIVIHQHYFLGSADWWVSEYDPENNLIYGYACLGDQQMAEWGYTSFDELKKLRVNPHHSPMSFEVDRDLYWDVKPVPEIPEILACYKAQGLESLLE